MTSAELKSTKTQKIFIIEDEGEMCLLLNLMLDGKKMELAHVQTIAAAKEYLQKEEPAIIILDNKLPDGLGVDFIGFIRKNHPSVKIVMISGYGASAKDLALEKGADAFLEKPFTRGELYRSVTAFVN